ncbi:MAG: glycine zipper domain-containing protein [Candidatus Scalindua sp.]|nr:glycine zipper domain-containing protein [Candidatus Scalindua sp.]
MYKKTIIAVMCVAAISVLTTGCMTTTQKGTVGGAGLGAALGAGIGALTGNAGMGAAIGAGVGAVGGGLTGDHLDKKREAAEKADLQRQLEMERQSGSGKGLNKIEGHYEYVKKRKWVDTSKKERVFVEERMDGDRRIEGHYEDRNVPSGYWQEYEEKVWIPEHYE